MRQKFGDAVDGVIGDASEDVFKPGEGLDIHALTGSYETAQHCSCPTSDMTPNKHPVAATHRKGEFIVHLISKCLKTWTFASRNSADTDNLFVRSP